MVVVVVVITVVVVDDVVVVIGIVAVVGGLGVVDEVEGEEEVLTEYRNVDVGTAEQLIANGITDDVWWTITAVVVVEWIDGRAITFDARMYLLTMDVPKRGDKLRGPVGNTL